MSISIYQTEEEAAFPVPDYPLLNIPRGFTPDADLRLLIHLSQRSPSLPIVEIGCNTGVTLAHLALYNAPRQCYGYDIGMASGPQSVESCIGAVGTYAKHLENVTVVHGPVSSCNLPKEIGFVFIDGDHTYDGCRRDFNTVRERVCSGGVIAFHDYTSRSRRGDAAAWVGVGRVVDEAEALLGRPFRHVHGTSVAYFVA